MADPFNELLDVTMNHLRDLKASGRRFVAVSPDTLKLLEPKSRSKPELASATERAGTPSTRASSRPQQWVSTPALTSRAATAPEVRASPTPPSPLLPQPASVPAEPALAPMVSPEALSADKSAALAALRRTVLACTKCGHLVAARTNVVFGVGNPDADVMFVGEAPGADEDLAGEPFVGKAGQLLTKIIQTMGFSREQVYIANILKCRPDTPGQAAGNRKPTPSEMSTCIGYLEKQIDIIKPKVLVALGATAVEGLLGKTVGITRLRGNWQFYRGIPLMPTYHPAYLLRNQSLSEKRKVWEDLLKVMTKLNLPISEKQQKYFL
jgi:DNA polymerase